MKQLTRLPMLLAFTLYTFGLPTNYLMAQANIEVSSPSNYITKLQDIHVDDNGQGFAGGRCGVLLGTANDGQTWDSVDSPTETDILTLACTPNGCSTALLDSDEGMFRFSNGNWTAINTENGGFGGSLHWLTNNTVIHETSGESYFRSSDGGLTWSEIEFSDFQRGNMNFVDANTGFVWVGKGLYKTTDAGATFVPVGYTHPDNVFEQTWLNDQRGWIFGSDRLFYVTTNGGQTWDLLNSEQQLNSVNWMVALSESHLVGAQVTTFRIESLDGGVTWSRSDFLDEGNERVNERYHRRGNEFFTIGDANQIMYSPADFTDFVEQDAIERHNRVTRIVFHTSEIGYAADGSRLMRTTDGETWSYIGENLGNIQDLALLDDGSIAMMNSSRTVISRDQGATFTDWIPEGTVPQSRFGSNFSVKPNGDYYILGSGYATLSTDGGNTWTGINHGTELSFNGIQWITDDIGYAHSRQNHFAKTTDGGMSWSVGEGAANNLEGMYFLDEMNGWVSTAAQRYATTDGGQTWNNTNGGGGYDYQKSPDDGSLLVASYLGGNNGAISRSTDEGQTWQKLNFNCFAYRAGTITPDGKYYWAGGDGFLVRHDLEELIDIGTNTSQLQLFNKSLQVYPNPSDGRFTVDLPMTTGAAALQVFELGGRQVYQLQLASGMEHQVVDLSGLSPGVYIVRWLSGGQVGRAKIVIR